MIFINEPLWRPKNLLMKLLIVNNFMSFLPSLKLSGIKPQQRFSNPLSGRTFFQDPSLPHSSPNSHHQHATISYSSQRRSQSEGWKSVITNQQMQLSSRLSAPKKTHSSKLMGFRDSTEGYNLFKKAAQDSKVSKGSYKGEGFYTFPQVDVIPVDFIHCYQDIHKAVLSMSLESYFTLMFQGSLSCKNPRLNQFLERHLPSLVKSGQIDEPVLKTKWPKEFFTIHSTSQLLQMLQKYTQNDTDFSKRHLFALMKIHCLAHSTVRKTCLENMLTLIHKQLENKGYPSKQDSNTVVMLGSGKQISEFVEISFSTRRLFVGDKHTIRQGYDRFLKLVKDEGVRQQKTNFIGRMRSHFRHQITAQHYDDKPFNYHSDAAERAEFRRISVEKAGMILSRRKVRSKIQKNRDKKEYQLNLSTLKPKSRESLWKASNVEDGQKSEAEEDQFALPLPIMKKQVQEQIRKDFAHYHQITAKDFPKIQLNANQIAIEVLEQHHPFIHQLQIHQFHIRKIRPIFEAITGRIIFPDEPAHLISFRHFVQLELLCSKQIHNLLSKTDCHQLSRSFVESYLGITHQDYFRDEFDTRLASIMQGSAETLCLMEDVIWRWLGVNGFLYRNALQRELLWTYSERSRLFYELIASMVFGHYRTTPLDLAHDLLQ